MRRQVFYSWIRELKMKKFYESKLPNAEEKKCWRFSRNNIIFSLHFRSCYGFDLDISMFFLLFLLLSQYGFCNFKHYFTISYTISLLILQPCQPYWRKTTKRWKHLPKNFCYNPISFWNHVTETEQKKHLKGDRKIIFSYRTLDFEKILRWEIRRPRSAIRCSSF